MPRRSGAAPQAALPSDTLAALDLGSNSFHLIVARVLRGQLRVVDRLREMVQLGAGLDARGRLSNDAQRRALDCLRVLAERLRGLPAGSVRCVGTNTLRRAANAGAFIARAERVLGHPIEVIGGREEARLIYLGVSHTLTGSARRLVLDIGGGSTELIIGQGYDALHRESLSMGCVSASRAHFPNGRITKSVFAAATLAARQALLEVAATYRGLGWEDAIGASGTILATQAALATLGIGHGAITRAALAKLMKRMIAAGHVKRLTALGIGSQRAAVFPGGVAILAALMDDLGIRALRTSEGALREGLLYDLIGRIGHEDARVRAIEALVAQHHLDSLQAARVERSALALLKQAPKTWKLDDAAARQLLSWAARLHEVGLSIAHNRHHQHGAYILQHADLAGFSRQEQLRLALLVGAHRRRLDRAPFTVLPDGERTRVLRLALLLRLAVLLHRSRSEAAPPRIAFEASGKTLRLRLPARWRHARPLLYSDLEQERAYLKAAGFGLVF